MPTNPTEERNPISFRLRKSITDKLTALAEATGRSKTFLAEAALDHYCELHNWQVEAILKGMEDAKAGRVMAHEAVKTQWMQKRDHPLD